MLDAYEAGTIDIPDVDMVVGGFPCQDYSVAKPLSQASGIVGKKGVLWWDIYRFLRLKNTPRYVLLENVDRLLKSPRRNAAGTSPSSSPASPPWAMRSSGAL